MNFLIPDRWAAPAAQYPELAVGRITLQEKGMYRLRTIMGEQNALVSGKLQFDAQSPSDYPAVGDYVMVSCADPDTVIIHQVLPRKSLFLRKAAGTSKAEQVVAANIDTVFLCMSLNNDFNLRRLERYLAVAWESGAAPVVVLTKADLCADLPQNKGKWKPSPWAWIFSPPPPWSRTDTGRSCRISRRAGPLPLWVPPVWASPR